MVEWNTHIAETEKKYGNIAAASEAARYLLAAVGDFDHLCTLYDPDGTIMPIGEFTKKRQREVTAKLTEHCNQLRLGIACLSAYLNREEVWDALCEVNAFPATIGTFHAPCYAEAAYKIGRDRYYFLWVVLDHTKSLTGVDPDLLPIVEPGAIMERGIEGFIRGGAMHASKWDQSLADLQIFKEYERHAGKSGNRSAFDPGGGNNFARFQFPQCPKCGADSRGNGTKKSVRYAKCTKEKCGHSFKLPK